MMIKKVFIPAIAFMLIVPGVSSAQGQSKKEVSPSDSALEHANENARFKRDPEWFANKEAEKESRMLEKKGKKVEGDLVNAVAEEEKDEEQVETETEEEAHAVQRRAENQIRATERQTERVRQMTTSGSGGHGKGKKK